MSSVAVVSDGGDAASTPPNYKDKKKRMDEAKSALLDALSKKLAAQLDMVEVPAQFVPQDQGRAWDQGRLAGRGLRGLLLDLKATTPFRAGILGRVLRQRDECSCTCKLGAAATVGGHEQRGSIRAASRQSGGTQWQVGGCCFELSAVCLESWRGHIAHPFSGSSRC